jgi:alpha-N-acetylglucosamine transferase
MMLFNNRPQGGLRLNLRPETIETLSSLSLTAEQKTSLENIIQPSDMNPPEFENNDSLITELKTGKATKESLVNILKTSNSSIIQESELDMLSKIHALLNSEQRTKFIDTIDFNSGGPNGMGMPDMQPRF